MSNEVNKTETPKPRKTGRIAKARSWFAAQSAFCKVLMVASAIMLLLATGITAVYGVGELVDLIGSIRVEQGTEQTPEPEVPDEPEQPDEPELDPAILLAGEDAGSDYLKDTLFIGDSNYARMVLYELLDLQQVIGVEGMGIGSVVSEKAVYFEGYKDPVTIPEAVKLMQPRRIVMNFGTNNLVPKNTTAFISSYKSAIAAIQKEWPYADIIIQSIPAISKNRENQALTMDTVNAYNEALLVMCNELGLRFLNVTDDILVDAETGWAKSGTMYTDGIHLEKTALNNLLSYVRTHPLLTEDTRPALTKVPKQKPAPKPVEEKFDTKELIEAAMELFLDKEYIEFTGEESEAEMATAKKIKYTVYPEAEPGDETKHATALVNYIDPQVTVKTGTKVSITCEEDEELGYIFTVTLLTPCSHSFGEWTVVKEPTATEAGMRSRTCSKCKLVEEEEVRIDPELCTHSWGDWLTSRPATETDEGISKRTCSICLKEETKPIPAIGGTTDPATCSHNWSAWVDKTPASYTAEGSRERSCGLCGKVETETIPKLTCSHSWGDWVVDAPATEAAAGSQHRVCGTCGATETQTIPQLQPTTPPPTDPGTGAGEGTEG